MRNLTTWMLCLVVMSAGMGRAAFADIGYYYFYDDLNRLTKAVDSTGVAIGYVYDEVGNHVSVTRAVVAPFAILGITPPGGSVGTRVVIEGRGFSAVAAENVVSFNGVDATVVSTAAGRLEVDVPAGATTGPVSVSVGTDTTNSGDNFVVRVLPVVLGLSPRFVLSGATLSSLVVTGENLSGSGFAFTPAFVPAVVTVDGATVAADGGSAQLAVGIGADAVGTFVLQASNGGG